MHTIRLTEYFHNHKVTPVDQKNESLVKGKSMFYSQKDQFFTRSMDRLKKFDESARQSNQRSRQGRSTHSSKYKPL